MSTCDQLSLFDFTEFITEAPKIEVFNVVNLLTKFDAVVIENVSLITDEDKKVCEAFQRDFDETIHFIQMYLSFYREHLCSNKYFNTKRLIDHEEARMKDLVSTFITDIFNHFRCSYSITVETRKIEKKYDHTVTYQEIVDEIILQMDGLNFKERAAEEIRNKVQSLIYKPEDRVKVKSNCVRITNFLWFDELEYTQPRNARIENLDKLLSAIEYFESGAYSPRETIKEIINGSSYRQDWFDEFSFETMEKFNSFKCFKNGSIQLKFASSELAVQFAKEYLQYTN